jgi:Protein of unknown function (DUF2946)
MDDLVKQAMIKWPNVPHCHGWLGLDERGDWYMRDERVQARGSFVSGCANGDKEVKGSKLEHEKLIAFIGRNYSCELNRNREEVWFFQNGPQKVYVELASTPYIWRLSETYTGTVITSHTGLYAVYKKCQLDVSGRVYLVTNLGTGLVHSLDVPLVATAIEKGFWSVDSEAFVCNPSQELVSLI